jgi:anti-sigma factor RsiW
MADLKPLSDDERAELIAYLDGEADEKTARAMEARMNREPQVRAEAEALRRSYDLLDYLPKPEPSPNFTNRTMTRVSAAFPGVTAGSPPRPRHRWALGLGWAAALLVAGVVGYAGAPLFHKSQPAPDGGTDADQQLVRELRVIDNLRPYQDTGDIFFLYELDRPELFGDDQAGR